MDAKISALSSIGTYEAFVYFIYYGDYWWISIPIPCVNASNLNIQLTSNINNFSEDVKVEISKDLFRRVKTKQFFSIQTNDQDVAGYIFKTTNPNILWKVSYIVS